MYEKTPMAAMIPPKYGALLSGRFCIPLLALLIIQLLPRPLAGSTAAFTLYYTRFVVKTHNGVVVESRLEMIPAYDEFRLDHFQTLRVTGYADQNAAPDMISAAQHDAIQRLLTAFGLKSVNSRVESANTVAQDMVVMCYEGVIRYPFQDVRDTYLENESLYQVNMGVSFTPLAFPSEWSSLLWRHRLKETLESLLFLFR